MIIDFNFFQSNVFNGKIGAGDIIKGLNVQKTPCICRRACPDERLCKQKFGMY